jgi:hypothetical protein
VAAENPVPLQRAHAHNDYSHGRPLLDALGQGFCSVEADIFLDDGELRVGHFRWQLRRGRTLESLYLKPLAERARANGGHIYSEQERFILLVDIKENGARVYPALDRLLERYSDILTGTSNSTHTVRAVTVILSGGSPRDLVKADPIRYCAIDGRPPDLGTPVAADLVPLISDSWRNHFKWRGWGEFPAVEAAALSNFVARAHDENRLVRFWAAPDNKAGWRVMHEAGVDLINTDHLGGLSEFLQSLSDE